MAKKIECHWTKEIGDTDKFYLANNGKYYKSKDVYDNYKIQMEIRQSIIDMFSDLLGYYDSGQFNTQAMKELTELKKTYTYINIYDTLKEYYSTLEIILRSKAGMNDFSKAKYIFAVVKNNINDICDKNKRMKKAESLIKDKQIDIDIINNEKTTTSKPKDISEFLDY